jgi:predicted TIM-barrel fold metal-dependent hydrolase
MGLRTKQNLESAETNTLMRTITIEEHFSLPQEHQRLKEMMNAPDCSPTTSVTVGAALAVFEKMIDLGEGRLADMDAAGIDMQILQIAAAYFDQLDKQAVTSLCRESNDILSQAVRSHPDRFAGFAQLPIKDPEAAVKELERCVSKLGFKAAVWSGIFHARGFTSNLQAATAPRILLVHA